MLNSNLLKKALAVFVVVAFIFGIGLLPETNFTKENVAVAASKKPKYVFYFIGDGMGATQRTVAEYYLQEKTQDKNASLAINNALPYVGINTTHSADSLITDSAAAGTALASGYKTNNGVISQLPNGVKVKTLIELAEEKGMATGIVTTTRLTHATPAVFAAHNVDRNNENDIAADFVDSGVDYFAGGGYRYFVPKNGALKSKRTDDRNIVKEFQDLGYQTFVGENSSEWFKAYEPKDQEKVFAAFTYSHMPYEIDRVNENLVVPSLAEITEKGIKVLSKDDDGFFMMVEGGRIDHASHANDAAGTINDTLAFDEAVKKALDFYKKHKNETLILVVGDHETGGLGLGFGKNYFLNMNELVDVEVSVDDTLQNVYNGDREEFFTYISEKFGLDNLTATEKTVIEKAMDQVDNGIDVGTSYGGYNPVAIAATHILSERANVQWTTYAHSGTAIPFGAVGVGAENFSGYKDNTDIAKTLADVLNLKLGLLQ